METIYPMMWLLFFVWILFLPQFLGLLVHYRIKSFPKLAHLTGFLLTTILSFFLLFIVFTSPKINESPTCGLGVMAEVFLVLFFTTIQIIVSLINQFWIYKKNYLF